MARYYHINTDIEPILEIQRYLLEITPTVDNPGVTKTGVFDTPTIQAIQLFQQNEGLKVSGKVDLETWELLWSRYIESIEGKNIPDLPDIQQFDMSLGDTGYHIILLQTVLGQFSEIYPNVTRPAITGQFGLTTADAVRAVQRNYGLYADGIITQSLWNRILRDHRSKKQLLQYSHIFDSRD